MKETIETIPRIELALIIIGVFVLILGIILGYAMIHEYRMYLDDHYKARYSFRDFIKRERFYIYLFFASIFIFLMLKTEDIHPPKTGISVHFSGSLV